VRFWTLAWGWASLAFLAGACGAAEASTVKGTVSGKRLRSSEGIVVSLEAPGLEVKPPKAPVRIDQKSFQFVPHVTAVVRGTTVRFLNSDPEQHNVYSPEGRYDLGTWPPGEWRDHVFDKEGAFTQLCKIHPDMLAFVVVLGTPYFAVADKKGRFTIKDVPAGKYKLVAWSEKLDGLEQEIVVKDGQPLNLDLFIAQ